MINNKKRLLSLVAVFSAIELILAILVQITDGTLNKTVSFLVVILACAFVALFYAKTKEYYLTQIALVGTVFADFFLVVLDNGTRELAMVFFSITQICYFLRLYFGHTSKRERQIHLILRGIAIVTAMIATIIVLKEKTDFLSLISLFYYANLIINVVYAFVQVKKSLIFALGLVLFALCDLFIGFGVLGSSYLTLEQGTLWYWLAHPGFNLAWLFYVPSQALLALSLLKTKLNELK